MRWSKVKKLVEESFASSIRGRVQIYTTHYANAKGGCQCGRGWITLDGKELVDFSSLMSTNVYGCQYHETTSVDLPRHPAVADDMRTPGKVIEDGEFSRFDLHEACWDYLHQSLKDSLESENPLIRSIAVLNAKVGKQRLRKLQDGQAHPLTMALLRFRFEAETRSQGML